MPEKSGPWNKTVLLQGQNFSDMVECKRVSLLELEDFFGIGECKRFHSMDRKTFLA
jgi:hypothetical protein